MALTRLYCEHTLKVGEEMLLASDAHHKLVNVLRAKTGDQIWLFNGIPYNGEDGDFLATITALNKKTLSVLLIQFVKRHAESPIVIQLAQALPKAEKMDFILQKAVELGANYFIPLITSRTNMRLTKEQATKKHAHWRAVIQHACEQSGRNRIPVCEMLVNFNDWVVNSKQELRLLLQPTTRHQLIDVISSPTITTPEKITVCVGPEGGLTQDEIALAEQFGFKAISLGPRVLRTETASLAILAILQFYCGDIGKIG